MAGESVTVEFPEVPFRTAPKEAGLAVTVSGRTVSWTPDPGLGADRYLVIGQLGGKHVVLATTTRTTATLPTGATLLGVQPERGARVGRLAKPVSAGSATSPLRPAPVLPAWSRRVRMMHAVAVPRIDGTGAWKLKQAVIDLSPAPPGLSGKAILTLVGDGTQSTIAFRLLAGTVTVSAAGGAALPVSRNGAIITVDLGSPPPAGAQTILNFDYTITDATTSGAAGTTSEATSGYFFFSSGVAVWPIPVSATTAASQVALNVHLPSGWSAGSGGPEVSCGSGICYAAVSFAPLTWPALASGPFLSGTASFTDGTIEVLGLVTSKGQPDPGTYATEIARAADVYSQWGKPATDHVAVTAVSPNNGGYSVYGLVLTPDNALVGPFDAARAFFFFHELSHQWWGSTVYTTDQLDLWLREGMADFSAITALDKTQGATVAQAAWKNEHDQLIGLMKNGYGGHPGRDVPVRPSDPALLQDYVYYLKGALVLRHLEGVVGAADMNAVLSKYLGDHRYLPATTSDFEADVRSVTGRSLAWFWHEWLQGTGLPDLTYAPYFSPTNPSDAVLVVTQSGDQPFPKTAWVLPVRITTQTWSGWACVNTASQTIALRGSTPPRAVAACP